MGASTHVHVDRGVGRSAIRSVRIASQQRPTQSLGRLQRPSAYRIATDAKQLYQLYLNPANSTLVHSLYVEPCSSSSFVQLAISHQLQSAAAGELVKSSYSSTICEADIMRDATDALSALSELLAADKWFFGQKQPSMLDASVFAYTQLILDESLQWGANELAKHTSQHQNLVDHRDRILTQFF